mgnify:CR=1 FL=1
MPIIKSAKKAARQAEKRTEHNVEIKKAIKAALKAFKANPTPETLAKAQSEYDKAVKKDLMKKNKDRLTYTTDYDYKPAICFFEGSKQMKDYETLMAYKNEDLSYLCKYIKVFYFATEQKDNIVEFEIKEIEG